MGPGRCGRLRVWHFSDPEVSTGICSDGLGAEDQLPVGTEELLVIEEDTIDRGVAAEVREMKEYDVQFEI